ncbi:Ribosomal protein S18 acetylase RimI [Lachnospiraceae bacterium C7]|nr:Ribosomal protein S18 acetylase RimI [Lachnospiraceae bacterium C7]
MEKNNLLDEVEFYAKKTSAYIEVSKNKESVHVRPMKKEDYEQVYDLWLQIQGFGIRTIDDSKEGVYKFLERNPGISTVAVVDNGSQEKIVGAILCGHDGRRGCMYHVCVNKKYRKKGIGKAMTIACMRALQKEKINVVSLIAYKNNEVGNQFWHGENWNERQEMNYYDFILNDENITNFNE